MRRRPILSLLQGYLNACIRLDQADADCLKDQIAHRLREQVWHQDLTPVLDEISDLGKRLENLAGLLTDPEISTERDEGWRA